MSETLRLRLKVGVHEFDAEGPKDEVNARFEAWQAMIAAHTPASLDPRRIPGNNYLLNPNPVTETPLPLMVASESAQRVFTLDERRGLVTLRIHPMGDTIDADAVLLLLYGYKELQGADEVPVTRLTQSMRLSGLRTDRIDRAAAPHVRSNLLFKNGSGKGGRYALTNTGRDRAQVLTKELYDRVA